MTDDTFAFLSGLHPYDSLPEGLRAQVAADMRELDLPEGATVYELGRPLDGLYVICEGSIAVRDATGADISLLQRGNSFGERGLMRDGTAVTAARAKTRARLLLLPRARFDALRAAQPAFARFFERGARRPEPEAAPNDLTRVRVEALMARDPIACTPETPIAEAARKMRDAHISCLPICAPNGPLAGLVTLRDMVGKALAAGLDPSGPVSAIMTAGPRTLPPSALGSDVLHLMAEHRMGHLPIVSGGRLVGIVTQTDLTRFQSATSAGLVAEAAQAADVPALAAVTQRIPQMLVQLVAAGHRHDAVTRSITDLADVVTRRLLALAQAALGPAPARFLWAACGSQGRQEQTGVSDQDNVLILEDGIGERELAYFARLARFVSDGLDACGYVLCPGEMMATNPRWCQPVSVWRDYFAHWIAHPSKEAQMLASVMFDLRPIGGDVALFEGLQAGMLRRAAANSIFTAHMATNALSHAPPLGLLRGFATIRSGEHRATIDMKHSGVVPVVDLGRMYALQGRLTPANTRARLEEALAAGIISGGGGRDLLDAYDMIADTRLAHQAELIRRGARPDNYLPPAALSEFERSHLRDAFVVVKTMQSALMSGRGSLG
jgi:CBS domain-containing protein